MKSLKIIWMKYFRVKYSTNSFIVYKKKKVNELLFVLKKNNDAVEIKKAA